MAVTKKVRLTAKEKDIIFKWLKLHKAQNDAMPNLLKDEWGWEQHDIAFQQCANFERIHVEVIKKYLSIVAENKRTFPVTFTSADMAAIKN